MEPPKWYDYDFLSEKEFERWAALRYQRLSALMGAEQREPGGC